MRFEADKVMTAEDYEAGRAEGSRVRRLESEMVKRSAG